MENDRICIGHTEFVKSAQKPHDYPPATLPEIAFVGRSNVGKSTLINVLVQRKNLVRTSSTPGRTQLINFFDVDGRVMFVDLPGYGFAKVPPEIRRQWQPMIEAYLSGRENLKAVVLILDVRRIPSDGDQKMLSWLRNYGIPTVFVLTKCDKLTRNERNSQISRIVAEVGVAKDSVHCFSALSREGRDGILKTVFGTALDDTLKNEVQGH